MNGGTLTLNPPPPLPPHPYSLQVRAVPIRKDDEVLIKRGKFNTQEGKVMAVYRKKFVIHVERMTKEKANSALGFFRFPSFSNHPPMSPLRAQTRISLSRPFLLLLSPPQARRRLLVSTQAMLKSQS